MMLTCPNCDEYIELPDSAVGSRAQCPLCRTPVMVERPSTQEDHDYDLKPVDEQAERKCQERLEEVRNKSMKALGVDISQILRSDRKTVEKKKGYFQSVDVEGLVIDWLLFTHAEDAVKASDTVAALRGSENEAKAVLARLTVGLLDGTTLAELEKRQFDDLKMRLRVILDGDGTVSQPGAAAPHHA